MDHPVFAFWHLVNTPFHEAGHVFFRPLGRFMTSLGGSLGQVLMPMVCMAVLMFKTRDPFGASIALWWCAQNFIDLTPYIADARSLSLPLLGGNIGSESPYGFHDWNFILTEIGHLHRDRAWAGMPLFIGRLLMVGSLIWGGMVLYRGSKPVRKPRLRKARAYIGLEIIPRDPSGKKEG